MSEKSDAVDAFKAICLPKDENALDREWLEMCGFFVKGWLAKSAQHSVHPTASGVGRLARFGNWLSRLGNRIANIGGR